MQNAELRFAKSANSAGVWRVVLTEEGGFMNAPDTPNLFFKSSTKMGFWRWLAHEAVRANPLYVISAALLAYAIQQLMEELDPQIGKVREILQIVALLHIYEIAVLIVATVVLKRRARAGLDMHGLLIVAALFLGASFIALDELTMIRPWLGAALIAATLALAAIKLAWYARLPGVLLPWRYRAVVLAILGAHALSPLLGARQITHPLTPAAAQGLAWLAGWVSLLPVLYLIIVECRTQRTKGDPQSQDLPAEPIPQYIDPLGTRLCCAWAVGVAALMGVTHLFVSDWIHDYPSETARVYPAAAILAAAIVLLRWRLWHAFGFFDAALAIAPLWMLQELTRQFAVSGIISNAEVLLTPWVQLCAASFILYIALARGTGCKQFYAGLAGPVLAPAYVAGWKWRNNLPHFRALVTAGLGFAALVGGMILSLNRERLLRWLSGSGQENGTAENAEGAEKN